VTSPLVTQGSVTVPAGATLQTTVLSATENLKVSQAALGT
jgi:hypothetical protein